MSDQFVSVTIGRNIGSEPMTDFDWRAFQEMVKIAATEMFPLSDDAFLETHYGTGEWDGVKEESAKIAVIGVKITDPAKRDAFADRIRNIGRNYRQDAVAVAFGFSRLVS